MHYLERPSYSVYRSHIYTAPLTFRHAYSILELVAIMGKAVLRKPSITRFYETLEYAELSSV